MRRSHDRKGRIFERLEHALASLKVTSESGPVFAVDHAVDERQIRTGRKRPRIIVAEHQRAKLPLDPRQ